MINSGTSNYPTQFDLFPSSGSPTIAYVVDQERNPITGIITVSGTKIVGQHINSVYTIIQSIEKTLGINPQGTFSDVNARFEAIATSGTGAGVYVPISGGTMVGDLYLNNVNLLASTSGISNLGSATNPFNTIYVNNIVPAVSGSSVSGSYVKTTGDSMTGNLVLQSTAKISGTSTATMVGNGMLLENIADSQDLLIKNEANFSDVNIRLKHSINSGVFRISTTLSGNTFVVNPQADQILLNAGDIQVFNPNASIFPSISGTTSLGKASSPFNSIYVNNMNSGVVAYSMFNEKPSGLVNSSNTIYTLTYTPYSGSVRVYENGIRIAPLGTYSDFDYRISGNTILFTVAPVSGTKILVDYNYI